MDVIFPNYTRAQKCFPAKFRIPVTFRPYEAQRRPASAVMSQGNNLEVVVVASRLLVGLIHLAKRDVSSNVYKHAPQNNSTTIMFG